MKWVRLGLVILIAFGVSAWPLFAQTDEEFKTSRGAAAIREETKEYGSGFYTDQEPIKLVSDEEQAFSYLLFLVLWGSMLYLGYRGQKK